tara:strand:- start:105 stop:311 length:207 start_codon:yes stop_codon:yes gene_type:complete
MEWLRKKLKRIKRLKELRRASKMDNDKKDVTIEVTGVSMSGEASINEHDGPIESDKEEPTKEENRDSD